MHTHLRRPQRTDGFTIIELLVVIAILFLLITAAFIGLRSARKSAGTASTLNAVRQIMTGYTAYTDDHAGLLLPGYIDAANLPGTGVYNPNTQLDIRAKLPGGQVLNGADTSGYVWRLAPYLDNNYEAFLADYSGETRKRYDEEYGGGDYGPGTISMGQYGIGFTPSIGYNSIYLGGDNVHGDGMVSDYSPWGPANPNNENANTIAARRMSDILKPAETIAFAACKYVNPGAPDPALPPFSDIPEQLGYAELRPPWVPGADPGQCDKPQWLVDAANQLQPNPADFNGPGGMMVDRSGGHRAPTGFVDGSTEAVDYLRYKEDSSLSGAAFQNAADVTVSKWSPMYARWLFGR